jgi:P pilus assembly chaperone PapD
MANARQLPQRPARLTEKACTMRSIFLLLPLLCSGCAVVAVADAAVTVAATTVKVAATVVETAVDVTAAGVKAVIGKDSEDKEKK